MGSQTANTVYAAPNGSAGTPSFRALVTNDIPWATPGTIGSTTPNTGAFTTLSTSGTYTATGNITQTGATTFSTGTGAVSLNGATTVAAV